MKANLNSLSNNKYKFYISVKRNKIPRTLKEINFFCKKCRSKCYVTIINDKNFMRVYCNTCNAILYKGDIIK